jgi:hypothetical protein
MLWPTKPRTTVCAVDRVLQLQSRVRRLSDDVSVRNDAAPVMAQFAGFSCSLSGETLIAEASSDYSSVDAARAALEPALHPWEASSELNQGLRFSFKYTPGPLCTTWRPASSALSRSTIATLSGALLAALGLIGASWEAASLHGGRITPEVADYAYAVGNVGFANIWIAMASFAVCSGWVILSTGVLERWMGWWIVVDGLGLAVARFAWTAGCWGVGYALFWLWIIVVCIRLIVRPDRWSNAER